jgi:hypothetical protein
MSRLRVLLLASALAWLSPAGPAAAGTLAFRGDVSFFFGPNLVIGFVSGSGVAQVNGASPLAGGAITQLSLPAGAFATSTEFPGAPPIGGIQIVAQNGAGSFTALTLAGGGGPMPVLGNARLCLIAPCATASLFVDLPLSVIGAGGTATAAGTFFDITLVGAPWTKATFTVSTPGAVTIVGGFGRGPLFNPGTTAQPGGVLTLATPVLIRTTLQGFEELPSYAILYLEFVPEPGALLAVAPAVAGLVALGRRRLRA